MYLGKSNIYSKELSNFKKEIERWIKEKYRDKRVQWEYSTVRIRDKSYKGWKDLKICDETL